MLENSNSLDIEDINIEAVYEPNWFDVIDDFLSLNVVEDSITFDLVDSNSIEVAEDSNSFEVVEDFKSLEIVENTNSFEMAEVVKMEVVEETILLVDGKMIEDVENMILDIVEDKEGELTPQIEGTTIISVAVIPIVAVTMLVDVAHPEVIVVVVVGIGTLTITVWVPPPPDGISIVVISVVDPVQVSVVRYLIHPLDPPSALTRG